MTVFAEPREASSHSIVTAFFAGLIWTFGLIPYALVALALRLLMARVFFLDGQTKIDGPSVPIDIVGWLNTSITLPAALKQTTFDTFATQYANIPMSSSLTAYLFTYAEFVLPLLLVIGFATRFAAVLLLAMTVLIAVYVAPEALWTMHAYWIAILVVLLSGGPGAISIDHLIGHLYRR